MTKRFRILVVDDERVNLKIISHALKEQFDIITAENGLSALQQVAEHVPDLVLLDVMMPDMSGFDVCKTIKADERYADIPIIFLTALDTIEGELRGLELGGIDYVMKPVNLELLALRVRNHIELKMRNDLLREQRDLLAEQKRELEEALSRVKRLEGIISICMHCKSIRTDKNSWQLLEAYITEHTDALLSHGICLDCMRKFYPEVAEEL